MLKAVPRRWYSWDFTVTDGLRHVADIDVSWWREQGTLMVDGVPYKVFREGLMSGAFILESAGSELARAEKPSAFRRAFEIRHADRHYTLRAESAFFRRFVLRQGDREVGSMSPDGIFVRRATVDFPDELPLPVRVFMIWLTVILWKRESDAAAAS